MVVILCCGGCLLSSIIMDEFILKELIIQSTTFSSESSSSSWISSSDSDVEEIRPKVKRVRISDYMEVIRNYSDSEFKNHFRLTRSTANKIVERFKNANILPTRPQGREKISVEKAVFLTLWYLANMETFREVADRFGCTESSVHRTLNRAIKFVLSLKSEIIKWPTARQAINISHKFETMNGIKNIIGLIDGSHIEIPKPKNNQESYCNRKGFHSLLLQGIVDHKKRFIDVFCGEPGSMNDARLFRKSGIYKKMYENPNFMGNYFLLGDCAYPNLHWVVTPFTEHGVLSAEQKEFNYRHSATRILVENAFGLLKNRFRRLRKLDNTNINFCTQLIMAACILHNICIDESDLIESEVDFNQPEPELMENVQVEGTRQLEVFRNMFVN